ALGGRDLEAGRSGGQGGCRPVAGVLPRGACRAAAARARGGCARAAPRHAGGAGGPGGPARSAALSGDEPARAGPPAAERGAAAPSRAGLPGGVRAPPGRADLDQPGRRKHGRTLAGWRGQGDASLVLGGLLASPRSAVADSAGSPWAQAGKATGPPSGADWRPATVKRATTSKIRPCSTDSARSLWVRLPTLPEPRPHGLPCLTSSAGCTLPGPRADGRRGAGAVPNRTGADTALWWLSVHGPAPLAHTTHWW